MREPQVPAVLRSRGAATVVIWTLFLVLLVATFDEQTTFVAAKDIQMLSSVWMSSGGRLISNTDLLTAYVVVPIAVKHFNERYGGIVPALASIPKSCNSTIRFVDSRMLDNTGISTIAMTEMLEEFNEGALDVVHGPIRSDVSTLLHRRIHTAKTNNHRQRRSLKHWL